MTSRHGTIARLNSRLGLRLCPGTPFSNPFTRWIWKGCNATTRRAGICGVGGAERGRRDV